MPRYDFVLTTGNSTHKLVSPRQEASDLDAAVRFAVDWAKDRRSIEGDPDDRSAWALDIVQSQKPFDPQPEVALYHLDDVPPDAWAKAKRCPAGLKSPATASLIWDHMGARFECAEGIRPS